MIKSRKFKEIETEFREISKGIDNQNRYNQEMCYLFEQALENIKKEHFDIAMLILCVIIESIASKKNYEEFKTFDSWLIENPEKKLIPFVNEIKTNQAPENIIKKWHEKYREIYGPRKNFINIIIETYKSHDKLPEFMYFETKTNDGVSRSSPRLGEYNGEELYNEFKKEIGSIYDDYRSPFVHQGKFLSFSVRVTSKSGLFSVPGCISLQQFAEITLNVMKENLNKRD